MCLSITFTSINSLRHCSRKACPEKVNKWSNWKKMGKRGRKTWWGAILERAEAVWEPLKTWEVVFRLQHYISSAECSDNRTHLVVGKVCSCRYWGSAKVGEELGVWHAAGGVGKKGPSKRNRLFCYIHPAPPDLDSQREFYSLKICESYVGRVKAVCIEIVLFSPLISWRKQVFLVLFMFASGENYFCKHHKV